MNQEQLCSGGRLRCHKPVHLLDGTESRQGLASRVECEVVRKG